MTQYYTTLKISEHIQETPEGYLLCLDVPIARVGELIYRGSEIVSKDGSQLIASGIDGTVKIQRNADVLLSADTCASFEGKPVVLLHPGRDENGYPILLDPTNWDEYACGTAQNVRPGVDDMAEFLVANLLITRADAIEAVKLGLREVSCGYNCEWISDDVGLGHQEKIIGNHIALVPSGRCGSDCAIQDQTTIGEKAKMKIESFKKKFFSLFAAVDEIKQELEKPEEHLHRYPPAPEAPAVDVAGDMAANFSQIVADLQQQLAWCKAQIEEGLERQAALEAVLAKLNSPDVLSVTDAAPALPDSETIALAEIIAPGTAAAADMAHNAMKSFYATEEGKELLDKLSCGNAPALDSPQLFVAAAECVKAKRIAATGGSIAVHDAAPKQDFYVTWRKATGRA